MEGFKQPEIKTQENGVEVESRGEKLMRAQEVVATMFKEKWQQEA